MRKRDTVLILDDEPGIRMALRTFLEAQGFDVLEASRCEEAAIVFRRTRPDAMVLDFVLPDGDALSLMARIREIDAEVPIVILTAYGSIDLAVQAVKQGAEHFFTKPVELPTLAVAVQRAIENRGARRRVLEDRAARARWPVSPFTGSSVAIRRLKEDVERLLPSDRPLLILGETGTGKGVLARWLHEHGPRCRAGFVDLNCAGLARELFESELFGHAKGAFTGAVASKPGLLEVAHRGTLFLDEIGDIDLTVQPKVLKAIEEMRFRRLGDVRDLQVDVRIVAATHQDLGDLVSRRLFRADLYFRISALCLRVPALRERADDIPELVRHLLGRLEVELGRGAVEVAPAGLRMLMSYPWPGNIRELRNVLERALLLSDRSQLRNEDLRFEQGGSPLSPGDAALGLTLDEVERRHIELVLEAERGNVPRAAARLGIPRSTLYQRLKRHRTTPQS